MPNQLRVPTSRLDAPAGRDVLTVAAARAGLPGILRRFRADPDAEAVLVGSHRKADGAVVPMGLYQASCAGSRGEALPVLDFLFQRRAQARRKRDFMRAIILLIAVLAISQFLPTLLGG